LVQGFLGRCCLLGSCVKESERVKANAVYDRGHVGLPHVINPGLLKLCCTLQIVASKVKLCEMLKRMPEALAQDRTPQRLSLCKPAIIPIFGRKPIRAGKVLFRKECQVCKQFCMNLFCIEQDFFP